LTRRVLPVVLRPGGGPSSKPPAATQPSRRILLFMSPDQSLATPES
jgi:hypothetical protein